MRPPVSFAPVNVLRPLLLAALSLPTAASAQTAAERRAALREKEAAEMRVEADMVTMTNLAEALSKNLGQLHWLRTLCYGEGDQKWREFAGRMIEVEASDAADRRSILVRAFNAGYYQEQARHAACSSGVAVDAAALAENGRQLAGMLGDPYRLR